MIENLVIVESPAKAKTIEKFLGKDFRVVSSFGHIRDLAKKNLGIDIKNNFEPDYEVPKEKAKVVSELRKAAAESKNIWIASDEDREGEAIAWHLASVLKLDLLTTKRIVFHEITSEAISNAIENPRTVDMNLVNSQQARRILDRLVGFEISPVLWKKVQPSLSAGRVQSVAVRLIVEREREIISFETEPAFRITAIFNIDSANNENATLRAEASKRFPDEKEALKFLELCNISKYSIASITIKPGTRSPAPPFTTSTLQQEAYRKLGFSVAQTMAVAQKLYEAGKITYMRTDSTNLSNLALVKSHEMITSEFGEKYSKTRQFKTKSKGAQEAHEAIRPAYLDNPATAGSSSIVIYCTGLGAVTNQPPSGSAATSAPLSATVIAPTVSIGGKPARVLFAGAVPGLVGEYQVNVLTPAGSATGNAVPVTVSMALEEPAVTVALVSTV